MLNRKSFYIIIMVIGISLIATSILFRGEELKTIYGVILGIGVGLFGISAGKLVMKYLEAKNPKMGKQNEIEFKDERNTVIRNRAKSKAADITQWFILGIGYITIIISAPLWVTIVTVSVFLLYTILWIFFTIKYQKIM